MSHVRYTLICNDLEHFFIIIVPFDSNTKELISRAILETVKDIAHKWKEFGIYLGIPHDQLQAIQGPVASNEICMYETLITWISLKPQDATIHNLISAIRGPLIDNELLAQYIESDSTIKEIFEGTRIYYSLNFILQYHTANA